MLKIVEAFLAQGFGVFPTRNKIPLAGTQGHLDAIWRTQRVLDWPTNEYGLVPAPDVLVIDIDVKEGKVGLESWRQIWQDRGPDPDTFCVQTPSGGWHLYYRVSPDVTIPKSESKIGRDIDVRGNDGGGYVIGPGSPGYRVVADPGLARAPDWLVNLCRTGPAGTGAAVSGVAPVRVPIGDLRKLVTSWQRKGDRGRALAAVLSSVVEGSPYARQGVIYGTTRDLAYWLAREQPYLDRDWFARSYLEPCWLKMWDQYEEGRIDRQWVRCWDSAVEKIGVEKAARKERLLSERQNRIVQVHGGTRDSEYKDSELSSFAQELGVTIEEMIRRCLIVQCGREHYIWCNGEYLGPFVHGLVEQCRDLWSALGDRVSVEKWVGTDGSMVFRSASDVIRLHGTTVDDVRLSTSARVSSLSGRVFVKKVCPLKTGIEPEYSRAVDAWLRSMCGSEYERVLDWIATIRIRDKPAPALWLVGKSGCGKTLLAKGLAALWGKEKPTDMRQALSRFNSDLESCSLVLADEYLPTRLGRPNVEALKVLISNTAHTLEKKGLPTRDIEGCLRVICASNNNAMLDLQKLTAFDMDALLQRSIFVSIPESTKSVVGYLARYWLRKGTIAKHAVWLEQNRHVEAGRFVCSPGSEASMRGRVIAESVLHEAIYERVLYWLGRQGRGQDVNTFGGEPAVRVFDNGNVGIQVSQMQEECTVRIKGLKQTDIRHALDLITVPGQRERRHPLVRGGHQIKYRVLDWRGFVSWSESVDNLDKEECEDLRAQAKKAEVERIKRKISTSWAKN